MSWLKFVQHADYPKTFASAAKLRKNNSVFVYVLKPESLVRQPQLSTVWMIRILISKALLRN